MNDWGMSPEDVFLMWRLGPHKLRLDEIVRRARAIISLAEETDRAEMELAKQEYIRSHPPVEPPIDPNFDDTPGVLL